MRQRSRFRKLSIVLALISLTASIERGASGQVGPEPPPAEVAHTGRAMRIPVATPSGTKMMMGWEEYERYTRAMASLPVMSHSYIFGNAVAMPQTDRYGHIRLSPPANGEPAEQPAKKRKAETKRQPSTGQAAGR